MANSAAWLTAAKARPFDIKPAPSYKAGDHEILVKNHAIAINPLDGGLQTFAWYPLQYPTILGCDVAGEVIEVGHGVTKFRQGDRVLGVSLGLTSKRLSDNAFQTHTVLQENLASIIPDQTSYEDAAVVPLGVATAASALFQDAPFLQLRHPTEPAQPASGQTVLIWGGSSSVGSNGIQLARAAGYEVIVTASPKNFEYVKRLGANQVFDYSSPAIVDDLVDALRGRQLAGTLDCIGGKALETIVVVVQKAVGKGTIASTKGGIEDLPEGITVARIFGTSLKDNAVGDAIFRDYLPRALTAESFVPSPAPEVVGHGLEHLQEGVDRLMKGVSAKKLVISL